MTCLRCEASQKMLRKQARQAHDQSQRIERLLLRCREAEKQARSLERRLAWQIAENARIKAAVKVLREVAA